jgi:hypothetical protein
MVNERQAESHATETPANTLVDLVESVEDANQFPLRDPDPGIGHSNENSRTPFVVTLLDSNVDGSTS